MRILPLTNYQINSVKTAKYHTNPSVGTTSPVQNNEITFGHALKLSDAFMHQLKKSDNAARLHRLATVYLDIIEGVAKQLSDLGVEFNRMYCEKFPVKSPEATLSKVTRSGSLKVPDQIRATLFCKNLYDLSILKDHIIPAFAERGFVLAPQEVPVEEMVKKGYNPTKNELKKGVVVLKDLDIRLDRERLTNIVPELNNYVSHPQASGYEDIQIRFVRDFDTKENPTLHELIIIFGDNYSKAKHYESEKIYKHVRKLDELKFYRNTKSDYLKQRTKDYITAIKSKLSLGISKKLFESANSLDVLNIDNEMLINVSEQEIKELGKYFSKLREKGHKYYEIAEQRAKTSARLKKIKKDHESDSKLLAEIRKNLKESIDFFNEKQYFKNLPNIS